MITSTDETVQNLLLFSCGFFYYRKANTPKSLCPTPPWKHVTTEIVPVPKFYLYIFVFGGHVVRVVSDPD